MKTEIKYTTRFRKQYRKLPKDIKATFAQILDLFLEDSNHPVLRNHQLKEEFTGYKSINVTEDWRAVFKERTTQGQKIITFHMIGTHSQLYK